MHDFNREIEQRAEQIVKLPVWARDLLFHMQRDLQAARKIAKEVTEGVEGNTAVVNPHGDFPVAIGVNPLVEHDFADLPGHRVQVTFGPDGLEICESGTRAGHLAVYPRSSNVVMVVPTDRVV